MPNLSNYSGVNEEHFEAEKYLVDLLNKGEYRHAYDAIKAAADALWPFEGTRIVKRFTDHSTAHSYRLLKWVRLLLAANNGNELNNTELFLLLSGVFLHDIGMQCDLAKYPRILEIAVALGARFEVGFTAKDADSYSEAEQAAIRDNHHLISAACLASKDGPLQDCLGQIPAELLVDLQDICKFHSSLPILRCENNSGVYKDVRKRLVAALLRFADELDVDRCRVSAEYLKHFPLGPESARFWHIHKQTHIDLSRSLLTITLCLNPKQIHAELIRSTLETEFLRKNQDAMTVLAEHGIGIIPIARISASDVNDPLPDDVVAEIGIGSDGAHPEAQGKTGLQENSPALECAKKSPSLSDLIASVTSKLPSEGEPTRDDLVRLYSLSASRLFGHETGSVLGNRETNLLYECGRQAELSFQERFLILRTMLADRSDCVAGWLLFDWTADAMRVFARNRAYHDLNSSVREGAICLLASMFGPEEIVVYRDALQDSEQHVRDSAAKLLAEHGSAAEISTLNEVAPNLSAGVAHDCLLTLTADYAPEQGLQLLESLEDSKVGDALRRFLPEHLTEADLVALLRSGKTAARLFASRQLMSRNKCLAQVAELVKDQDVQVKQVALEARVLSDPDLSMQALDMLIRESQPQSDGQLGWFGLVPRIDDSFLRELYLSRLSRAELEKATIWLSTWGCAAYKILTLRHFEELSHTILHDVNEGFRRIRSADIEKGFQDAVASLPQSSRTPEVIALVRKTAEDSFNEAVSEYDDFIQSSFQKVALAVIAEKGTSEFAPFVRARAASPGFGETEDIVRALGRIGDASDADTVAAHALAYYGSLTATAAEIAVRLSASPAQVVTRFVEASAVEATRTGLLHLSRVNKRSALRICRSLLMHDSPSLRVQGVAFLVALCNRTTLRSTLNAYTSQAQYYFNVVCWLDRVLYSPEPIRSFYQGQLSAEITR